MINQKDPLMEEIISVKSEYDILPVSATLEEDTIVPGIKGKEIDVNKSYDNMKSGGIFREEALIFRDLYPMDSILNNIDKYIVRGNDNKRKISLLIVLNNSNINKVMEIDNITIFINHKDITTSSIKLLKNKELYTYGDNGVYDKEMLTSDNALINKLSNNKSSYCLTKQKKEEILNICSKNNMYTVLPNIIGGYYEIKNNLSNGSIILLDNINDIDVIIKYIKSKGYVVVGLNELLSE